MRAVMARCAWVGLRDATRQAVDEVDRLVVGAPADTVVRIVGSGGELEEELAELNTAVVALIDALEAMLG